MNKRNCYWRRKGDKIIAEGRRNNKTEYLFTLPDVETLLNTSFLPQEKTDKIKQKIMRLDIKKQKVKKQVQEVPTIKLVRTPEKDAANEILKEILAND